MNQQPQVQVSNANGKKPDNYQLFSILSLFCFCCPFGMIASFYSRQVSGGGGWMGEWVKVGEGYFVLWWSYV